jgi:uncharacterized protein (TIGR03086 family)
VDPLALLDRSAAQFEARLVDVQAGQWTNPTPCSEWNVWALVNHVVTANVTGERLLHGATREETVALIGADLLGDAPADACRRAADAQAVAFREPGALERIVHHPAFDMRGARLLDFRIGDMLLHTWDLARGIGADETLDAVLVEYVWDVLEPMADGLAVSGAFGAGASDASADASLQARLLDLTGRRP